MENQTPQIQEVAKETEIPVPPASENKPKFNIFKSKFFLGFVILSALIAFLASGFYLGKNQNNKQVSPTPTPKFIPCGPPDLKCSKGFTCDYCTGAIVKGQPTPKPNTGCSCIPNPNSTSTPAATANWKTYKDTGEVIEFKYPSTWTAKNINDKTLSVFLEDKPFEFCDACEFMTSIQITYNWYENTETGQQSYSEKTLAEGEKRIKDLGSTKTIKVEKLKVGGRDAVMISGVNGPGPLEGREFIYTLVQMNGKLLIINLSNIKYSDIYNEMLKTFKFTK